MSGYRRIVEACRAGGYPVPEWQELGAVVRVTFQPHPEVAGEVGHNAGDEAANEAVNEAANERQRWVLGQLSSGRVFRTATLQQQFGCSRATAQRDLADLVGRGLIDLRDVARLTV